MPTQKGWRVAEEHIYVDDGVSGAEFVKRPGLARLMSALIPRGLGEQHLVHRAIERPLPVVGILAMTRGRTRR